MQARTLGMRVSFRGCVLKATPLFMLCSVHILFQPSPDFFHVLQ